MNRKFKVLLIGFGLLIVGYMVTHLLKIDSNLFKVFIYGLLGLTGAYDISNVAVKKIIGEKK